VAREVWPLARITGVELRDGVDPPGYSFWHPGDFPTWAREKIAQGRTFDLVIGNPPYGKGLAEEFVRAGLDLLPYGGRLMYLLRMSFNEGRNAATGCSGSIPMVACYSLARRPSFTGDGQIQRHSLRALSLGEGLGGADEPLSRLILSDRRAMADYRPRKPLEEIRMCHARRKGTGLPCGNRAVVGWRVCRMHGAGGGRRAKHGLYIKSLANNPNFCALTTNAW
jgi:hypothetical protein